MTESPDRRVQRTRSALNRALFELIAQDGYDRVTVQDIIDRANVGRSTFYSHYETKDDLLLSSLDLLTADLDAHLPEPGPTDPVLPAYGLFAHVDGHFPIFEGLFKSRAIELVTRETQAMLQARALRALEARTAPHPVENGVRAAFLAASLMAFVQWWMAEGRPHGPQWAASTFDRLVEGS